MGWPIFLSIIRPYKSTSYEIVFTTLFTTGNAFGFQYGQIALCNRTVTLEIRQLYFTKCKDFLRVRK